MSKKLIIEIEDKDYERACKATMSFDGAMHIYQAIAQSIPYNPSGDYISREALKDAIENQDKFACLPDTKLVPFHMLNEPEKNYEPYVHLRDIRNAIDNAPTVDLWQMRQEATENALKKAEVLYAGPKGEWIKHIDNLFPEESTEECPFCHEEQFIRLGNDDNFCPGCGADMRGGAE